MGASHSFQQPATYSVVVPGTESDGATPIRRSAASPDKLVGTVTPGVETLYDNFRNGLRISANRPCLGWRPVDADGKVGDFVWQTYAEVWERILNFGSGLKNLDLVHPNEDGLKMVAHYLKNCPEWTVSEQASNAWSHIVVPLYDTLGPESVTFILNQTNVSVVVVSPLETPKVLDVAKDCPSLKAIVQTGEVDEEHRRRAKSAGLRLYSFAEVEQSGKDNRHEPEPPKPDDISTFCYTSGTTGDPKGAMISNANWIADVSGATVNGLDVQATDIHISYLPLAHTFERIVQCSVWHAGGSVGFYQGDTRKIMEDLAALRPTVFPSVPRLFNKIYDKITQGASAGGGIKASLFAQAMDAKLYWLRRGHNTHALWDSLVFNKVKARLGLDRVRIMLTGSAPLADHVMDFLRATFGVRMQEGYGQTENSAAATITWPDDYSVGHVGGPLACNEVRLVDVPEMDYLSTDTVHGADPDAGVEGVPCCGRGEVCLRGPNVFKGYYKNDDKTAEALDADGWLHTGDIGLFTPNGAVKIIDRKKNIFKLSQGEYVAAEKVEGIYCRSPFVAQMFVHGDSLQSCVVGIAVPDEEYLAKWAKDNGVAGTHAELCANPEVKKVIWADLEEQGKAGKLHGFEKIRALHLDAELWSVENDLLTPTFKLKRNVAKKHYARQIDEMYASGIGVVAGKSGLKQGSA